MTDTATQLAIEALVGYVTVPLASLVARRRWPAEINFAIALIIAVVAAGVVVANSRPVTLGSYTASFGRIFAMQQITWGLKIPGAGSPSVNEAAANVGRKAAGEPDDEGHADIEGMTAVTIVVLLVLAAAWLLGRVC